MKRIFKPAWHFLIPLFLLLLFLSFWHPASQRAPWYEQWVWNIVSPLVRVTGWCKKEVTGISKRYFFLVRTGAENQKLRQHAEALQQTRATLEELRLENRRLEDLLGWQEKFSPEAVAARVLAYDPRQEYQTVTIDKGAQDGVATDMPVISPAGLVGRVGPIFSKEAVVLLIIDPSSFVDVLVERSRIRSLATGTSKKVSVRGDYFLTRLEYLKRQSDITVGDIVVTSGLDRLYPKGIVVGEVHAIRKDAYGIFLEADVVPAADFSRLEEVLVLKKP